MPATKSPRVGCTNGPIRCGSGSLRARLAKELPPAKRDASEAARQLAHRGKALITLIAGQSVEMAQMVVAGNGADVDGSDGQGLPAWFLTEVVRDLPRLAARRS